jgi:hypothetical protein
VPAFVPDRFAVASTRVRHMQTFQCSNCSATIDAEDLNDLMAKGWHVLYSGDTSEGSETILCHDCFRLGKTISPSTS